MQSIGYPARPRCTPPNFARVDPDISSGKLTITAAWREYAAHAPRPYARGVFHRLYRQWQATSPADEVAEFTASENYWRGRAAPRSPIIVLDDGASIRMKAGLLEVFNRGETRRFDPSPHHRKPRAIVFANWGGNFTVQAARFCVEHDVTIIAAGWLGQLMTFVSGHPKQDAALVRAQCSAPAMPIARLLVVQKVIHYHACGRLSSTQTVAAKAALRRARTVPDIMFQEARWSSLAWNAWAGLVAS